MPGPQAQQSPRQVCACRGLFAVLLLGERLIPHFDHLELRGPAFGLKAVALGSHGALLGAPLCGLGHIRVGHIRKGGCACGFGPACGVPHQQSLLHCFP